MAATCGLLFIMAALLIGAYNTVGQVKMKVDQTLQMNNVTSSRDEIILDRFPLVMENINNAIFGIGYGNSTYNQYLEDHNAPKNGGVYSERNNGYNIDEPFFMIILYNVGAIGLFLFTAAFSLHLKTYISEPEAKKIFLAFHYCALLLAIFWYIVYLKRCS